MQVPSAPKELKQTTPVYEGADHKSKFEYPMGDLEKPNIPKDLKGKLSQNNVWKYIGLKT